MLPFLLWPLVAVALLVLPAQPEAPAARRIALRVAPSLQAEDEFRRFSTAAERRGLRLEVAGEEQAVPPDWEVLRIAVTPPSPGFARRLARFPIRVKETGFSFDGRDYLGTDDAVAVSPPVPSAEVLLLGNSPRAVRRLTGSILWSGPLPGGSYRVVSSELRKEGRFSASGETLRVDRARDKDEIAERDRFFRDLRSEPRGPVTWRYPPEARAAVERWQNVLARHLGNGASPITVTVFPDTMTKARYRGSSRPADLAAEGESVRLELDASAPGQPDLITPALASAAIASREPGLLARPLLLLAEGARRHGRWWERDVVGFAAFTRQAGVSPTIAEVLSAGEDLSPVLAVGTAASWLHAGAAADGEPAVLRALAGPEARLRTNLERWEKLAGSARATPPFRRAMPSGFLRGVSYAMSNRVESSYASPRSLDTLRRLARMSVNSISIMPFGFSRTTAEPSISFIHLHPAGETDEGTVLAVQHAHELGMSAMLKPQIWLGGGGFVGEIAMTREEDWDAWFADYRRYIVHNAVVGEAAGAGLFCVGTELARTEARQRQWREVIAAVRLATGATLLYASNWAAGAVRVPFWDALDAIGADFYDPLSTDPSATDAALVQGARRAFAPLASLAAKHRKPVIFAEAGYPPTRSAWLTPHEEASDRPLDPEHAARAISAVFAALEREPGWKGVFWWKVFSEGRPAGLGSRDFNILGRPAERAIASAYARMAGPDAKGR